MTASATLNWTFSIQGDNYNESYSGSVTVDNIIEGGGNPGAIDVTTGETTIDLTGISNPRLALVSNLSDTNSVFIGPERSGLVEAHKLLPGDQIPIPLTPNTTYICRTENGTARIQFLAFNGVSS